MTNETTNTNDGLTDAEQDAYERGIERGENIASGVDLPEIGANMKPFTCPNFIGIVEDVSDAEGVFFDLAYEAESNSRQFSPFEFTANEFNESDDPDALWTQFDEGVAEGIRENWESRMDYYTD